MGKHRLLASVTVVLAAGLLSGCGSTSSPVPTTGSRPATTTTGQVTTPGHHIAVLSPCTDSGEIRVGVLDAFRMGAVGFSSVNDGVGLTVGQFPCFRQTRDGYDVGSQNAPEQLAITQDGGRTWKLAGTPLPVSSSPDRRYGEFVLASSPTTIWAVASDGRAFLTSDAGKTWTPAPLPGRVVSLEARDGSLWALTCSGNVASCHPTVSRRNLITPGPGGWTTLATLTTKATPTPQMSLLPGGRAVVSTQPYGDAAGRLYLVSTGGPGVKSLVEPRWSGRPCRPAQLATSGSEIWVLCLGGAAAGSSTKALLVSADGGASWQVRSSVRSLTRPTRPTGISRMEPNGLAASTNLKLWLGLRNGLSTSGDGGRNWYRIGNVNPQGTELSFDVVSPTQVYALAPGAGLWRTTDGTNWAAVGPLNTG